MLRPLQTQRFQQPVFPFDTRLLRCAHCSNPEKPTSKMGLTSYALCGECHRLFAQIIIKDPVISGFFDPIAYFSYDSLIRSWIHRAKIANEEKSRTLLVELFTNSAASLWGQWADLIIASPSSLWGRLRGRINLAGYLAYGMAMKCKKPLLQSPLRLQGRITKRAQNHAVLDQEQQKEPPWQENIWDRLYKNTDKDWINQFKKIDPAPFRILIIDDVYTTGQTLQETSAKVESLLENEPLQICKLALSRTPMS